MFQKTMRLFVFQFLTPILLFVFIPVHVLQAETVSVPMKVDFPLLRQLFITQLFKGKSVSTEILEDSSNCSEIILSDPQLSEFKRYLKINTRVKAKLAVNILNKCVPLMSWDGYAEIISDPAIKPENPNLIYLKVVDSHLINLNNKPLTRGKLWKLAKKHFHPLFDRFRLDMKPTINELKTFLPLFLPRHTHQQLISMLDTLALSDIKTVTSGIQVKLSFDVETIKQKKQSEVALTERELKLWQQKWQSMDALLTNTIKFYAAATELKELRLLMLNILIDARYRLQEALQKDQSNDPVRHWFINSWSQLIPVLQQISTDNPKHATLGLMTMITATDVLQAMDKFGPNLGLDISINGLRKLARMFNDIPAGDPLQYQQTLDPELIRLFPFQLGIDIDSRSTLDFWPIKSANATNRPLNRWIPDHKEITNYLLDVRKLLRHTAKRITTNSKLTANQKQVFSAMVMATAWQESCWRQYVVKKNKIVPISSSTGDTGIMQVNETVWRGFVDQHKLRWDIEYNVQTGSNILFNYLTRYVIKNEEHKLHGGLDNLARASYSAYNGGPTQYSRYRKNKVALKHQKIDKSFYTKYMFVKRGKELSVAKCLGLDKVILPETQENHIKLVPSNKIQKAVSIPKVKKILNERWINQNYRNHFTIQLGVFTTHQAAKDFISQQVVAGNYAIYQQIKLRQSNYAVIYGYYSTRSRAEKEKALFILLKPWVRSFKDIQSRTNT